MQSTSYVVARCAYKIQQVGNFPKPSNLATLARTTGKAPNLTIHRCSNRGVVHTHRKKAQAVTSPFLSQENPKLVLSYTYCSLDKTVY